MLDFDNFVKAVQQYELNDELAQAATHTSAVNVEDWKKIKDELSKLDNNNAE